MSAFPLSQSFLFSMCGRYTDKKENTIFLIYKEIQMGAVANSYMRRPLVIYDFATAPFWIFLYMKKKFFSFLSV